jgi:hypothetical protein
MKYVVKFVSVGGEGWIFTRRVRVVWLFIFFASV